jgi:iron complex outermembrane receptor protein
MRWRLPSIWVPSAGIPNLETLRVVTRARLRVALAAALMALASTAPAFADPAVLSGKAVDGLGAAIAAADVRVRRDDGTLTRHTATDGTGAFALGDLPPGAYVVEIEKPGFRADVAVVAIASGAPATHDVELGAAGVRESVVVTASGLPQSTQETSKAVNVIEREELTDRNTVTVSDAIRLTPGVQVRDTGGPGQLASLRLRGLRYDGAAVLVDGLRLRDAASTQGDVSAFFSNLAVVAYDRVEVLRGSASSLYGTNAVGGAVNIVTGDGGPRRTEGQVEFGSLGHSRLRGTTGGTLGDGRVSYEAGGIYWLVRDGLDGNDRSRNGGGQGSVRVQIDPATSLGVRLYGSDDDVESNVSPTTSGVPAANIPDRTIVDAIPISLDALEAANAGLPFAVDNATFIPGRDDPDNTRGSHFLTTAVTLRRVESDRASWQASYQRVGTHRSYVSGPRGPGFQTATTSLSDFDGSIDTFDARAFLPPSSWLTVTGGYEFEHERYEDLQDDTAPVNRLRTATAITQSSNALFGAAQFALAERRLQVSLAGRWQAFQLGTLDLSATGAPNPYEGVDVETPPHALTGDVSVAYLFADAGTKLRGHVGNAYRAPALYERFGGGFFSDPVSGQMAYSPYGDPRLRPDRYTSFDAGVDQTLAQGRVLVSASVFAIDVASLTAFDFSGGIDPATDPFGRFVGYLNGSGGSSRGVELSVDVRPTSTLRLAGSYTYTRARTEEDITVPDFFIVPGVYDHTASFYATRQWTPRFDTTMDVIYVGESFGSFFAAGRTRAYRYPGSTTVGLGGSARLFARDASRMRAYVRVDNLFNETTFPSGWRALGRTAVVGVRAGF